MISELWNRRILVVTGKGGVGRSTVSAAIAVAAARAGKRVLLAELYGLHEASALWGLSGRSYTPRRAVPGVDVVSLTAYESFDDFGERKMKMGFLARAVLQSRPMRAFIDAVPGLHDMLQLGKLENMLQEPQPGDVPYDLCVLDAPATGHGLTLLQGARAMREMTRVGPFADLARIIEDFLADDRKAAFLLATLAEELPAQESVDFIRALGVDKDRVRAVVVNQLRPPPFPAAVPLSAILGALEETGDPDHALLAGLAARAQGRHDAQQRVVAELRRQFPQLLGRPVAMLGLPAVDAWALQAADIERLASALTEEIPA